MPNDAKFGLVVGVGIVLAVAIVFFRKEPTGASTVVEPAAALQPVAPAPAASGNARVAKASTTSRQHTVAVGETLFTLAEHYYGDKGRFTDIYQANRRVLRMPDELPPGTVLEIPEPPVKNAQP